MKDCLHGNLKFDLMGQCLRCEHCGRYWFPLAVNLKNPSIPNLFLDFGYTQPRVASQFRTDPLALTSSVNPRTLPKHATVQKLRQSSRTRQKPR